ncbi:hypothetical protein AB205_0208690, partial [Aquarana catesbeiana]
SPLNPALRTQLTPQSCTPYTAHPSILHSVHNSPLIPALCTQLTPQSCTPYTAHPSILHPVHSSPFNLALRTQLTPQSCTLYTAHPSILHSAHSSPLNPAVRKQLTPKPCSLYIAHPSTLLYSRRHDLSFISGSLSSGILLLLGSVPSCTQLTLIAVCALLCSLLKTSSRRFLSIGGSPHLLSPWCEGYEKMMCCNL